MQSAGANSGVVRKSSQDADRIQATGRTSIRAAVNRVHMRPAHSAVTLREGDRVVAEDGELGLVERVLRAESGDRFGSFVFVVAVCALGRRRYPILDGALVASVDRGRGRVLVRGRRRALARLSESPPLVI
jgi:hypothetical protein